MIRFACPKCGKQLKAPEDRAGYETACPQCRTAVKVPPPMTIAAMMTEEKAFREAVLTPKSALKGAIPLAGSMLIGREQGKVQLLLPHVQVSRVHAQITVQGNCAILSDLNSSNGTFVNEKRIASPVTILKGDRVDIGPYSLVFTGSEFFPQSRANNVELVCRSLRRIVKDRRSGEMTSLLDDINLIIRPSEFVCILGPSGSGKSTLLSALSARVPADEGAVLLNHKDLYRNYDLLKHDMVVVPQKDVLHDTLSVESALWYTAKLRLPPDTSAGEVQACIDEMLQTVNLTKHRSNQIRHLSGGQIKRASLANELLCKPTLVFLDEVTSGLDEHTDRDMMAIFRSLADSGKTVICITHSLANVEANCHLVVILTPGGKLAFVGSPSEALEYFQIQRLGDVYEKMSKKPAEEWQKAFATHPLYVQYITSRLPPEKEFAEPEPVFPKPTSIQDRLKQFGRQTALLTRRYLAIKMGDLQALFMMVVQCLIVAFLLVVLFGNLSKVENVVERDRITVTLLFLLEISCFWFGCNNAVKEIVKERVIFGRERDYNLLVGSYFASKFILLAIMSGLQTSLLYVLVRQFCQQAGAPVAQWLVLQVLSLVSVSLGLAVSAASQTEDVAVTATPIVLVPQIILAGAIAPVKGLAKGLAMFFVTLYWGHEGITASLPADVARNAGLEQHSGPETFLVLLLHFVVFGVVAVILLVIADNRVRGYHKAILKWLHLAKEKWQASAIKERPYSQTPLTEAGSASSLPPLAIPVGPPFPDDKGTSAASSPPVTVALSPKRSTSHRRH